MSPNCQKKRSHTGAFPDMVKQSPDTQFDSSYHDAGLSPSASLSQSPKARAQSPQSQSAVPFIPGQWEPKVVAAPAADVTAARDATVFTTASRYAPTWSVLQFIWGAATRVYNKFARKQVIRAQPILCENGGRKKRFIDAGHGEPASPHTPIQKTRTASAESRAVRSVHNKGVSVDDKENSTNKDTSAKAPESQHSPILVRLPKNRRILQLAGSHANHTKLTQAAPHISTTLAECQPKPVAQKLRLDAVSAKARADKVSSRPSLEARIQASRRREQERKDEEQRQADSKAARYQQYIDEAAERAKQAHAESVYFQALDTEELSFLSDISLPVEAVVPDNIAAVQAQLQQLEYENDLKMVDAPMLSSSSLLKVEDLVMVDGSPVALKKVTLDDKVHIKHYVPATGEMLDSSVADINMEDAADVDDSSLSLEAIKDQLPAVEKEEKVPAPASKPEPSLTPAPIAPLLSELHDDQMVHIIKAVKMTNGGKRMIDLVEGKISTHDMKTLLPSEFNGSPSAWLNDNIVNEYLTLLTDRAKNKAAYFHRKNGPAPPVHAFASQFFPTAERDLQAVKRWAGRKQFGGKALLDVKLLLIPICDRNHWRLVAIKPQHRTIEYLDSLHQKSDKYLKLVRAWLKQELGSSWVESEWKTIGQARSMRQQNGSDCGVFACLNALTLLRDEDPSRVISDDGMKLARQHIAVSLISRNVNDML